MRGEGATRKKGEKDEACYYYHSADGDEEDAFGSFGAGADADGVAGGCGPDPSTRREH